MASDGSAAVERNVRRAELVKEGMTMALYVAICLLAALAAVADSLDHGEVKLLAIVWGTTLGLALAHWFAFRLSARLVAPEGTARADLEASLAQIIGAACVAVLASIPVVLAEPSAELDVARVLPALFIAGTGYLVARSAGSGRTKALIYGGISLAIGLTIAIVKNVLGGH